MALLDIINIDFHLINVGDPKVLVIMDTSVWGAIEDKVAAIEIVVPGSTVTKRFTHIKNQSRVFTSSNLLLSPIGTRKDLPDGVYKIDVIGAHGNCKHRDVLKTDKVSLLIGDLYLEDFYSCGDFENNKLKILRKIKLDLDAAEIMASKGDIKKASRVLADVYKRVRDYIRCRD